MMKLNKTILFFVTLAAMLFTSCGEHHVTQRHVTVDSLINVAYQARNYDSILSLADLHQQEGTLSTIEACYWRGYAYSRQRKIRMAEIEWKRAVAQPIESDEDLVYYAQSANRLTGLLYLKAEYGQAIQVALPAIQLLKEMGYTKNNDYFNLLTFIGGCELKLDQPEEAANNFAQVWKGFQQITKSIHSIDSYTSSIVGLVTIVDAYIQTGHYQEALDWTTHLGNMLQQCRQLPGVRDSYIDKQWARLCLYRASALEGLGKKEEAAQSYQFALQTQYAKTGDGKVEASNYLIAAHRWNEAADNLQVMASQLAKYDLKMSQETIHTYLLPKYLANVKANRLDSAIAVGSWICEALDSAIVWQKRDDAAELATIYETQQKENELMKQRSILSDLRLLLVYITLVLVILGFGLFIFFRHRAAVRLEKAYYDLERANVRAEESSRMKSDFIQQISHEIRTPLNILSGFTQLLTMPDITYDKATLDNIKEQVTENTDRITNLVNKMLELSEAKNHSDIECNDEVTAQQIASEAIGASGINDAGHLTFSMIMSPEAEKVLIQTNLQAAARALSQVLDNARKFTAPAESRQHEKLTDHQQKVVLRISVSANRMFFSVEDTGIGIPHKEAERIFDEFVQLDEFYEGTGIGLTVARSLARRIGGDIMLDTAYIGGSRFVLTLPVNKQAS
jgi:signal transduction histidine kinase